MYLFLLRKTVKLSCIGFKYYLSAISSNHFEKGEPSYCAMLVNPVQGNTASWRINDTLKEIGNTARSLLVVFQIISLSSFLFLVCLLKITERISFPFILSTFCSDITSNRLWARLWHEPWLCWNLSPEWPFLTARLPSAFFLFLPLLCLPSKGRSSYKLLGDGMVCLWHFANSRAKTRGKKTNAVQVTKMHVSCSAL